MIKDKESIFYFSDKALVRVTQAGESKVVILCYTNTDIRKVESCVAKFNLVIREMREFTESATGCWVLLAEEFDGMECRTVIAIDWGNNKAYTRNMMLQSSSCLIIISSSYHMKKRAKQSNDSKAYCRAFEYVNPYTESSKEHNKIKVAIAKFKMFSEGKVASLD